MDCTNCRYFSITDQVVWDKGRYPELVENMISMYGEGPYQVVGLRLHRPGVPNPSPIAVTVELRDGSRQEFAGEWFKKV